MNQAIDEITMHSSVLMHYRISMLDGTEIESSFDEDPVEVQMSQGELTDGMELALLGLHVGDEQTLTLTAEQGFGMHDPDNVHDMPRTDFPDDVPPEAGTSYSFEAANGEELPGTVLEVNNEQVKVDFNHPLAGHEIVFTVNILAIENNDESNAHA